MEKINSYTLTPVQPHELAANEKAAKRRAALIAITEVILDAITEAGTRGIPSGHLYAALMAHMDLESYNVIIMALTNAGKIKQCNYLLTAVKV